METLNLYSFHFIFFFWVESFGFDLSKMEAMTELCDLVAQNPTQFSDKLTWICNGCPQPDSLLSGSPPRVSRSQLNAILAVARFLSKCSDLSDPRPKSVALGLLRAVPASFSPSFWPQSYSTDSIGSFFADFLRYVSKAADSSPDFASEIADFSGDVVLCSIGDNSAISRVFLTALSQNFLPISNSDADRLVTCLIDQVAIAAAPGTPREHAQANNSEASSAQSSPLSANANHHYQQNESTSPGNEVSHLSGSSSSRVGDEVTSATSSKGSVVMNGGSSILWKSGVDQLGLNFGFNDGGGGGGGAAVFRQQVVSFEDESVDSLEKQEIAFKLIAHILDKVHVDTRVLEQVRLITKKQLQSLSVFLKVKRYIFENFEILALFLLIVM